MDLRRLAVVTLAAATLGGLYACVQSSSSLPPPTGNSSSDASGNSAASGVTGSTSSGMGFDKQAMLVDAAAQIESTYAEAIAAAEALETATAAWDESDDEVDRLAAQDAWREAMAAWQRAELMQVGPAGVMGVVAGGQDLRDEIYSWPLYNRCRVDQEIVQQDYLDPPTLAGETINVRGLDALEHLLFETGTDNACAPQNDINASGSWDQVADLDSRRAAYAHVVATLAKQSLQALVSRWADGFASELSSAGAGSSTYASQRDALNALSDAMFYLHDKTKDAKLAVPAGLLDCVQATCPQALEHIPAQFSKAAVAANIEGFERVYTGGEDRLGFDDWLDALGQEQLNQDMLAAIEGVKAALAGVEEDDFLAALESDPESVVAVHTALKAVTDLLKSDFVTVLDLDLPQSAEGDND